MKAAAILDFEDLVDRQPAHALVADVDLVVIRYDNVPLEDVIEGHGGLYWIIERERAGAPIHLSVRVDGETLGQMEHRDGEGWKAFAMPLGSFAQRPSATITFGRTSSSCGTRKEAHDWASVGSGVRFSGGRHLTTLQM